MKAIRLAALTLVLLVSGTIVGCASTQGSDGGEGSLDLLTREQIMATETTNLYDAIRRLRPRWLQVRSTRSFNMETLIAVMQNDMYLGGAETLKEIAPELAYEIRYMDGARAANVVPGLMSGQHIEAAIIVSTRPPGGGD
jgi:hypothetical protein